MTPAGHLGVAYLVARRRPAHRSRRLAPLAFGVLLPDVLDKGAMMLGATPYGRTVGHSLLFLLALSLGWRLLVARRAGGHAALGLLALGVASHLAVDLVDDVAEGAVYGGYVFSGWMGWPLTNPDMLSVRVPHPERYLPRAITGLELATVVSVLVLSVLDRRVSSR